MFSTELTTQGKLVKIKRFGSFSEAEQFAFEQSMKGYKAIVWEMGMCLSIWENGRQQ